MSDRQFIKVDTKEIYGLLVLKSHTVNTIFAKLIRMSIHVKHWTKGYVNNREIRYESVVLLLR